MSGRANSNDESVRQAVIAAYCGGMTQVKAAQRHGVSKSCASQWVRTAGVKRPSKTEAFGPEVCRLYAAGASPREVGRALGIEPHTVSVIVGEAGVRRNRSEAQAVRAHEEFRWDDVDVHTISPEQWYRLYAAPESGYPSVAELARRFGRSHDAVRRYLQKAGVRVRTHSEQQKMDYAQGRREENRRVYQSSPGNSAVLRTYCATHLEQVRENAREARKKAIVVAARRNSQQHRTLCRCGWCGEPFSRTHSRLKESSGTIPCCCTLCAMRLLGWRRNPKTRDCARPLILDRLRAGEPGEKIGATELEYEALERERQQQQEEAAMAAYDLAQADLILEQRKHVRA